MVLLHTHRNQEPKENCSRHSTFQMRAKTVAVVGFTEVQSIIQWVVPDDL